MSRGDGWYSCANWCGREVRVRGAFCPHCSWMDLFMCIDSGIEIDDEQMTIAKIEMESPYRGEEWLP